MSKIKSDKNFHPKILKWETVNKNIIVGHGVSYNKSVLISDTMFGKFSIMESRIYGGPPSKRNEKYMISIPGESNIFVSSKQMGKNLSQDIYNKKCKRAFENLFSEEK